MTTGPLAARSVLVTGGHGFLGRHVCARLRGALAHVVAPSRAELDLRDPVAVVRAFRATMPEVVVHLAARVGGIGANQRHPGTFWRDNLLMGVNVLEAARQTAVARVVVAGTVCAYPAHPAVPFREHSLWGGFPEPTNAPYGVAKRALWMGLDAFRREFGLAGAYLLPANLYGPGDHFDLESSHVIPAMIRRCEDARRDGADHVTMWGTGRPTREFLYVEDAAEAFVRAAAGLDDPSPVNLGTGREISMAELAAAVARATGYRGRIEWDTSRPDGQRRRCLDTSRAVEVLGWRATTSLEEGLERTVAWYRAERAVERASLAPDVGGAP